MKRSLAGLFVLALALGCASALPDVGPFVDATSELHEAIRASGDEVVAVLRNVDELADRADELETEFESRESAVVALLQYSKALQNIAVAGDAGDKAVSSLGQALTDLAQGVGVAVPTDGPADELTGVVRAVYQQIALATARGSLQEALSA